jgi:hypothetical protein
MTESATVTPAPTPDALSRDQTAFLSLLKAAIGLVAVGDAAWTAPQVFTGPTGLACRVHLRAGAVAARVEVLLPMAPEEFIGVGVSRLLDVQGALLLDMGWFLGVAPEGVLQLTCLSWIEDAFEAAAILDIGHVLAGGVIRQLAGVEADADASL